MAEVGKNLKKIRKEKNLTQDELAERLHCTRQTVSNYETGKSEPSIELLIKIAAVLEVEINDLIYGPKKRENGKQKKTAAVIVLAAALILQAAVEILTPLAKEYAWRRFVIEPVYLLQYVFGPFVLVLLGWAVVETGKVFGGFRIWDGKPERTRKTVRTVFHVLAVCTAVWAVLMLWTGADLAYTWYLWKRTRMQGGSFDSGMIPHLMPEQLSYWILDFCVSYLDKIGSSGGYLLLGAVMAVLRMEQTKSVKETDADTLIEMREKKIKRGKG